MAARTSLANVPRSGVTKGATRPSTLASVNAANQSSPGSPATSTTPASPATQPKPRSGKPGKPAGNSPGSSSRSPAPASPPAPASSPATASPAKPAGRERINVATREGSGALLVLFAYPMFFNLLRGGPAGLKNWLKAKFFNQPSAAAGTNAAPAKKGKPARPKHVTTGGPGPRPA